MEIKVSNNAAVMLYSYIKDPRRWRLLAKNGITTSQIKKVVNYIHNEAPATIQVLAKGYSDIFSKYQGQINTVLNAHKMPSVGLELMPTLEEALVGVKDPKEVGSIQEKYKILNEVYDGQLPEYIPYTPVQSTVELSMDNMAQTLIQGEGFQDAKAVVSGFFKESNNVASIKVSDLNATSMLNAYAASALRTAAYLPLASQVQSIFPKKIMREIKALHGENFLENLRDGISSGLTGINSKQLRGDAAVAVNDWFTRSAGNIMFLNSGSAAFQPLSITNVAFEMGTELYKVTPSQWIDAYKVLKSSPRLRKRLGTGATNEIFEESKKNIEKHKASKNWLWSNYNSLIDKVQNFGYWPTKIMDAVGVMGAATPYLAWRIKENKKAGLSDAEAKQKALIETETFYNENQQSTDKIRLSKEQKDPLTKYLYFFKNTDVQYAQKAKRAAENIKRGRGDFASNLAVFANYGIIQRFMFPILKNYAVGSAIELAIAAAMGNWDDEDLEDEKSKIFGKYGALNSTIDSFLVGRFGARGVLIKAAKNWLIANYLDYEKYGTVRADKSAEHIWTEVVNLSPVVSFKYDRLIKKPTRYGKSWYSGGQGFNDPGLRSIMSQAEGVTAFPTFVSLERLNQVQDIIDNDVSWSNSMLRLALSRYAMESSSDEPIFRNDMSFQELIDQAKTMHNKPLFDDSETERIIRKGGAGGKRKVITGSGGNKKTVTTGQKKKRKIVKLN